MDFGFNPLKIKIPSAQPVAFISNLPGGPLPPVQKPVQSKHQTPNTQSKQNRFCTLVLQILSPGIQAPHKFKLYNHQLSATNHESPFEFLQQPLGVIIASLHHGASAHVALACHVASIALVSRCPFVTCLERGWLGRLPKV